METGLLIAEPKRVTEVRKSDLELFIGQQVAKAVLVAGYKLSKEDIAVITEEVPKDVQTRFKLLELPEIKKAIEDGVRGLYGDYYGISTVSINKWLKGYIDSGAHNEYVANKVKTLAPLLEERTEPTQSEIDNIMREGIVNCFTIYQTTGNVIDYGSPKINWLLQKGIVCPTKEEREDYKLQAMEQLEQSARDKKESYNRIDRNEAKKEMEELLMMLDTDTKIQSLAKNMCLRDWFEEILESGSDIHALIK